MKTPIQGKEGEIGTLHIQTNEMLLKIYDYRVRTMFEKFSISSHSHFHYTLTLLSTISILKNGIFFQN